MIRQTNLPLHRNYHQLLAIGLVFFTICMSALVSRTVFERLPHLEDEVAYLFQAKLFARGDAVIDTPQPYRAYWQPFVVDYQPTGYRFGKYTAGWPLLLAVGVNLGQAWVVNAWLAGLTVALVYRLGREIFNPDVGVIAAALTAFSPFALLLNATLMGHTAALCFTTLFLYAYWRMEQQRRGRLRWAALAGLALGIVVITRPLTALGIAVPLILWSATRLILALCRDCPGGKNSGVISNDDLWIYDHGDDFPIREEPATQKRIPPHSLIETLRPLLVLGVVTLLIASIIPLFNFVTTNDPTQNLYTLIWEYDRIGFGECCGRHGHTLEKGVRQMRWDMALTMADTFGWQIGAITPEVEDHLLTKGDYFPNLGLSWILLPFGLLVGIRKRWVWGWLLVGLGWILLLDSCLTAEETVRAMLVWAWVIAGIIWMLAALLIMLIRNHPPAAIWTWLLLAVSLSLVGAHLAYWIGSQRYGTRYFFEGLTAFALVSALPIAWLMQRIRRGWWRGLIYALFGIVSIYTLYAYSTPRIAVLYRFNYIGLDDIAAVEARREDNRPLLVIVTGPATGDDQVLWRSRGSLMAVTDPHLDSDIVVAWDYSPTTDEVRQAILERFPDRQVIEVGARGNDWWFID